MVSAILPAFNEEKTIGSILKVLKKSDLIDEIIVVDDGSQDLTSKIALSMGVKVFRFKKNQGKGKALSFGVKKAKGEILLFLDADLLNLKKEHLKLLLEPLLEEKFDMTVGVVDRGRYFNWIFNKFESPFSGLRALKKDFWEKIPQNLKKGYFVESVLTHFAKEKKLKIKGFVLKNLKHRPKEQKFGIFFGFLYRLKMFFEIFWANFKLKILK